mmetsp:Transcript_34039/g.87025  ORF Transcript_34039/g.87025 Transcript_34039/m.87025 type:complete len:323 (-) Transcript_34039:70-1038(-)
MPRVQWKQVAPAGPVPLARSSHGCSCIHNTLYVIGGEHKARHPIGSQVHALDLKTGKWEEVAIKAGAAPEPRIAHAQAAVGSNIYCFGGRASVTIEEAPMADLHVFNADECSWSEVPSTGTPPPPRSFHKMVASGGKLYVFGGCGASGRLADLHEFDIATSVWRELPAGPMEGRGGATFAASADGSKLLVVGGFAGRETNDAYAFDIGSETWAAIPSEGLRPRSVCSVGTLPNGTIVIFGGEVDPSGKGHEGAGGFANDVVLFNSAGYLESIPAPSEGPVPVARGWADMDVSPEGLVLFGGLTGDDATPERLDDVWILTVTP